MILGVVIIGSQKISDAKHAVAFQSVFDHLSITRFKNVKRHRPVGEKHGVRKEDDSTLFRDG